MDFPKTESVKLMLRWHLPSSETARAESRFGLRSACSCQIAVAINCLFALLVLCGCQSIHSDAKFPWDQSGKLQIPEKIVVVWTEAVQHHEGQSAQRGFGGRVFFYDKQEKPLKVDGTLLVYVFDNDSLNSGNNSPEKKFVFLSETLPNHYSKCALGHSYSIWIPLGPVGAPAKSLSLVIRLDGKNGGTVMSTMARKLLPGTAGPNDTAKITRPANDNSSGIRQVQYLEPDLAVQPSAVPAKADLVSHTIDLTPSFTKRLQQISSEDPAVLNPDINTKPAAPIADDPNEKSSPSRVPTVDESSTHFESQKSQVPTTPSTQPAGSLPRRQPHRAGWLSELPPTPRSGFRNAKKMPDQSESELARKAAQYFQSQGQNPIQEPARTEY